MITSQRDSDNPDCVSAGDHPSAPARHSVPLLLLWPAHPRLLHPSTHRSGRCPGSSVILPTGASSWLPHRQLRCVVLSLPSELHRVNIIRAPGTTGGQYHIERPQQLRECQSTLYQIFDIFALVYKFFFFSAWG